MTALRFKVAPVWKGTYSSSTTYNISDEVKDPNGTGNYRSLINNNLGNALTDTTKWLHILDLTELKETVADSISTNNTIKSNEDQRVLNENARNTNETTRQNNETSRTTAEANRVSAESSRVDAESNRSLAETNRNNKEIERNAAETSRQDNETTRQSNESTRVSSESSRVSAESSRSTAETTRSNNETTRQSNETTRQSNETTRQSNEATRQSNEGTDADTPSATGSRWARYKKAESDRNAASSAVEGSQASSEAGDGTRWGTFLTNEAERDAKVDAKVSDITNLQNDVEDLQNTKANKDGYYSQMTVGGAEYLVGQTVDNEDYLIRPTASAENEVANGVASVLGMEGNSRVWNQLIKNGDFSEGTQSWSKTVYTNYSAVNNKLTIDISSSGDRGVYQLCNIQNGHKAYISFNVSRIVNSFYIGLFRGNLSSPFTSAMFSYNISSVGNYAYITTVELSTYDSFFAGIGRSSVDESSIDITNFRIFDLTLIFGLGNEPTTVTEFEAWLAEHVGTKPYYAYNAGTILSSQTLGIKTYGQNLLNPTTKQAKLIPYEWEDNSNVYTIKNVPSGATATFTPDNTSVAVSVDVSGGSLDITSYGSGVLELSAATSDTYVCMKWDEQKDDDVVPYEDHTYDFDVRKVYGKINGAGEYVQCFPNGMRSAGSVHDELTAERAIVRQVLVDLGDLSWSIGTSDYPTSFKARNTFNGKPFTLNALVTKGYKVVNNQYWYTTGDKQVRIGPLNSDFGIIIHDDDYNSVSSFQEAMDGVFMVCELDTPITYTDLVYRDNGIDTPLADVLMNITVNNWSMEEQLLTSYDNGNPTSIPATIKTKYSIDAVEQLDTLQKTCYFADDVKANLQALLNCINTNCAETLGGTFSVSDTATNKVFAFTFTPNTEPNV